ncbi:MAG: hypothetical protein JWP57_2333 [Spirosoma sp.]|nr:hypothetical protein [Spirosoma sp.]
MQGKAPNPPAGVARSGSVVISSSVLDTEQARLTVIAFLTWYKNHMQLANQIKLVNQQAGKPYSVNLKNGERYLTYLKSSHLLTDTYLNGWRLFFKERQEGFRLNPQTEGPPTGFDYDLVMLTQDVNQQLASLNSLKVKRVKLVKKQATVTCVLGDTYEFRLVHDTNRWLINEILNLSQV